MKQRLVGALILLSGGVVLWSLLFTGPAAYKVNETTQIPPAPTVAQPEPIAPVRPAAIPEVEAPEPLPEPPVPALTGSRGNAAPAAEPEVVAEPKPTPAPAPEPAPKKSAEPDKPEVVAQQSGSAVPEAWVIQVASFSNSANAESLRKRLEAKGYDAYVKSVKTPGGASMQRVFVGPELKKATAEQHKADIEKAFRLKALLHEYTP